MLIKKIIKMFLKRMTKSERALRVSFVGKRLKFKQDHWLERDSTNTELKRPS